MKNTIYLEGANLLRLNESLLFQRFNYYLVGNSLLVGAFIAVAYLSFQSSPELYNENLKGLAFILGWLGLGLSWFMAAINLHDAKILKMFYSHIRKIEEELDKKAALSAAPYQKHYREIFTGSRYRFNFNSLVFLTVVEPLRMVAGKSRTPAVCTWLVPFCLAIFWGMALCLFSFRSEGAASLILKIAGGTVLAYLAVNATISIVHARDRIAATVASILIGVENTGKPAAEKVVRISLLSLKKIGTSAQAVGLRLVFIAGFLTDKARTLAHQLLIKSTSIGCVVIAKTRDTGQPLISKIKTSAFFVVHKTTGL
jgi:hypothetical protein